MTLKAASEYSGLPYSLLWELVTQGSLPRLDLRKRCIYVKRADIDHFIESRMTEAKR